MLAAAVGIPYTASETELGRYAMRSISYGAKSVSAPVTDYLSSSGELEFGDHTHRDVERIWEESVDRYRYGTEPPAIASTGRLVSTSNQPDLVGQPSILGNAGLPPSGYTSSLVGRPVEDLREVLRFDITPQWVTDRFSRVTTVLADLQLDGLRVPLVTGTGPDDLAGSISYYFDQSGHLQRVMLHGFTGDPTAIVGTMTQFYGLTNQPTIEAGVYTKSWNTMPVHLLRITRAPIVYSDALHHRFTVFLELNQPDLRYGISTEAQRIVSSDRNTSRW